MPPNELPSGRYTLTVNIAGTVITYPVQITLLEGTWTQLDPLPRDYSNFMVFDRYVMGDWIYTSKVISNFEPSFTKYNYKTGETQTLNPLSRQQLTQGAAIIQDGNDLRFLCGQLIANGSTKQLVTNSNLIYHTLTDTWSQDPDFPGLGRRNAVLMQVSNNLYYGLGYTPSLSVGGSLLNLNDFWTYNIITRNWQQLSDYPGMGKILRASFIVNGKLYVTAGTSDLGTAVKETWCYDPQNSQWSRKADYPGDGWINLLTFSVGNNGYAGMGETSSYNSYYGRNLFSKMYKYDVLADKWTEISNFGGNLVQPFVGNLGSTILVGAGLDSFSAPSSALRVFKP